MNIAVTIFYIVALVWLCGMGVFALYKKIKAKKQVNKEVENEKVIEVNDSKDEK